MKKELFLKELNQRVKTKLVILQLSYFFDKISSDLEEVDLTRSPKEILKDLCIHWDGAPFYFDGSDEVASETFQEASEEITGVILETIKEIKKRRKNSKGGSYGKI